MAALTWDQAGTRKYELGVSKGVLYVQNSDGTHANGVAWNGLTAVNESPEGAEANDMWADDIKYGTIRSVETFKGTIEAYTCPEEFYECDGSKEITGGSPVAGLGVYFGQQERKSFGLSYVTKIGSDANPEAGYKIHLVYGATASPSERNYETVNDSPEGMTLSWEFDTVPVAMPATGTAATALAGFKPVSHIVIDSTKVNATKLALIEKALYGGSSSGEDPHLLLPGDLYDILTGN